MTVDTIFDCASLTKVIATTSSLMKLFEQGKFRLNDKITEYIPEFQGGKSDITIRNLMTHFSGLQPGRAAEAAVERIQHRHRPGRHRSSPRGPPGTRYVYSDINFILLGELVHRLSGQMLSDYARENIFLPLGMKESMFQPPASLVPRIAPTERNPVKNGTAPARRGARPDGPQHGRRRGSRRSVLHRRRPGALRADDAQRRRTRWRAPVQSAHRRQVHEPQTPPDQPILRGLGWDIDSPHSGNRGELFPIGSYGHTGFTGTSVWIDPLTKTYVILLANSVHPDCAPRHHSAARQGRDDRGGGGRDRACRA